ncbi:MAG: OmpH family outer membrane protein [Granulosicoccus sp.]|nr:OmpH family outer membrane protein [Granulosicoccus sp.]
MINVYDKQSWPVALWLVILIFSVIAPLSPSTSAAAGQNAALSRIGFVDIPYLIDRAPQALEAEQRLENEFGPRQSELEVQRAELAELMARLADSSLELPEAELAQLDRESRGLERRIKRSEQDFREELNIQKNNEFKKVRILVLEAIAEFGEQQDYDLIVSDGVLFANKRIDVTERILESLERENARLKSAN